MGDYGGFVGGEKATLHGATAFVSMRQVQGVEREHVEQAVPESTFSLPGGLLSREMLGGALFISCELPCPHASVIRTTRRGGENGLRGMMDC